MSRFQRAIAGLALLAGASLAHAQTPPPVVGTLSTSNEQQTSVRLNAQVTTFGSSTQVFFEYALLGAARYSSAGNTTIPGSSTPSTASVTLGNLTCGTDYVFRAIAVNQFGQDGPHTPHQFRLPCVAASLSSSGSAQAGGILTLAVNASGSGALTYEWDVDGDNVYDRMGTTPTLDVKYPSAFDGDVKVRVTDSTGDSNVATRHITIQAPHLTVTSVGTPMQVCGDGDAVYDPGERWSLPVRITNDGPVATSGGYATFSPTDVVSGFPPVTTPETHVVMETPAVSIGNLAPGASIDTTVAFNFADDAPCGARYTMQFMGGADANASSPGVSTPIASLNMGATCQVVTSCPKAKAIAAPHQGLFYTPSRAGNGLSNLIAQDGQTYFGAWFTATDDRMPTWYIVQGKLLGAAVKAPILKFTRDLGSSTFKVNSAEVGRATIAMIDPEHMVMTWTIGTKGGAEVMEYFTPGAPPSPNRTGAWYNPNESGWGEVVHQYNANGVNSTFAVNYVYDANAQPRWVIGQDSTANFANGTSQKSFQVHCPGCPWLPDWNTLPLAAGTASVTFSGPQTGEVDTNITLPAPLTGSWVRSNLPIQLLTQPQ